MTSFAYKVSTLLITTQLFTGDTTDAINHLSLLNILDVPVDVNNDIDLFIMNGLVAIASFDNEPSTARAFPSLENIKFGTYCLMNDDNPPETISTETFDVLNSALVTYSLKELINPKNEYLSRLIDHLHNKAAHEDVSYNIHYKRISQLATVL